MGGWGLILKSITDIPTSVRGKYLSGVYAPLKPLTYLVISDIHLGKKSVPARFLISQLDSFFDKLKETFSSRPIDIVFVAGDLFDQALSFTADDVSLILQWARRFFKFCAYNHIKVRILEGTPSHDRRQTRNLEPLAKSIQHLNFEYISTMCVEYFEEHGVTCLYVPDEFGGGAAKAQELIQKELNNLGLSKVSMAIMHGMCRYQVPELTSDRYKYDESFLLNIVDGFINIGHIHTREKNSRIVPQGSFGRLSHGEEEAKGGSLIHWDTNGERKEFFVENTEATKFVTVKITFNDVEKASAQLQNKIKDLPPFSHVRVRASVGHAIFNVLDRFKKEHVTLTFTKITNEEAEKPKLIDDTLLNVDYTPIHIDKENIVPMLLERVKNRQEITGQSLTKLENKLRELV